MPQLVFLISLLLVGCTSSSDDITRILATPEENLKTDTKTTVQYHSVLYYPHQLGLRYPGIIVGVEKSPTKLIARDVDINVSGIEKIDKSERQIRSEIVDNKILYVSHIVEFGPDTDTKACTYYDLYRQDKSEPNEVLIEPCPGTEDIFTAYNSEELDLVYKRSWNAMDTLKETIDTRLRDDQSYTHVIVATMGWNTPQAEAIQNFNSILWNLHASKSDDVPFKPLFIGMTWPSNWESDYWKPIVGGASFGTKARDADELGLTWLGVLLHQTLQDVPDDVEVLMIGHSFGARSMSVAACIGPAIYENETNKVAYNEDLGTLISLQGAYEYKRILGREEDKGDIYLYPDSCPNSTFWSTTSKHDNALKSVIVFGNIYAGDYKAYKNLCEEHDDTPLVNCYVADSQSELSPVVTNGKHNNVNFVNADSIILKNAYKTGGGAHSDIYRKEHGKLIWNILENSSR